MKAASVRLWLGAGLVVLLPGVVMNQRGRDQTGEALKELTRMQLLRLFPYKDLLGPEEFAFDDGEEIREAVVDGTLAARRPALRFFRTRLTTSHEAYAFADIVVAVNMEDTNDMRILTAPSFRPESPEFFELFRGMHAPKGRDRDTLTGGIVSLLASLTHEGSVKAVEAVEDRSVWNLFRGDISQNLVTFEFDQHDGLAAIRIEKGSGRK